ncbi:hypothetical protein PG984_005941 [Apiospora sp. TS-2023a]
MPPRPAPTHFLCIPLVTSQSRQQLVSALASFGSDVTSPQSFGLPGEAIRPVGTLHLTLGVMSFPKNEGLDKATELLKTLAPRRILDSIIKAQTQAQETESKDMDKYKDKNMDPHQPLQQPPPLSVTLKGLHSMQPTLSKATVLYSPPVDPDGILYKFCERIKQTFQQVGIMAEEDRPLLLHATIVNTIYVKGEKKGQEAEAATGNGGNDVPVEKIAICRMGAKKQDGGDEAYEVEAEIDMDHGQ